MVKFTLHTPVEVDIEPEEYLPHVRLKAMLAEIARRFENNVVISRDKFLDLADAIVELRARDAFALMQDAAPQLIQASTLAARYHDRLMKPFEGGGGQ